MTYFKTRGRRPIHIEPIDPRRIEAAIDEPRWWRDLADAAGALAPWVDFSAECPGPGPDPREFEGATVRVRGSEETEIVESAGLKGLAIDRELELQLQAKADVVDLGVIHFGEPPTIVAYAGKKEVGKVVADERPRQIENVRLTSHGIDRVTIASPSGDAILNYVRTQLPRSKRSRTTTRGG